MNNPYIYRGPVRSPKMFFGRSHELREIVAFLNGNQSVSIIGPRKIGKTSMLYHLMRTETWPELGLADNNLLAYLDCEVLGEGAHEEIFGTFASEIAAAIDDRGLEPEPALEAAIAQPTRLSFERAIRKLNQRDLRVVLILDEFERLSNNPSLDVNFFNSMRSAAGRYQLCYITASAQPLIQLTYSGKSQEILSSPFFNIFASIFLGLLPEADARQTIQTPAQIAGKPIPGEIENFIYNLVGGYPLGLQIACFHAFEAGGDNPEVLTEIERRTMQELTPHFEYYWHNLSLNEQDTLRRVPEAAARATGDTTLRAILRDLVQKCLLISEGGAYRYPMRAWANFINSQTMPSILTARSGGTLTGSQLGPYQVLEPIGRGGMAEVYKGRHPRLDRTVAIKVLPAKLSGGAPGSSQAVFAQRFEREARAVASLRHPNIVQVFDFGDVEGTYYMVMEYIRGQDLAGLLRNAGAIELDLMLSILGEICSALDYAHSQGLVHRDVKPSNVLLEDLITASADTNASQKQTTIPRPNEVRAVLTDFGIAKIFGADTAATQTGILMGTLDYMSPEQIRSAGHVDHRADIYALGVMAFQMLTGQVPFKAENPGAVMLAHLQNPPPDPRSLRPTIAENIALAVLRTLQKDPEERFASAGEFMQAIQNT